MDKAMDKKELVLTSEGRQKLVDELNWREGEKNEEIVERLKEARDFGDLSENSEYDAAKEEQSQNESRINEIRQILATAKVVEHTSGELSVSIGTNVELIDKDGKSIVFTIVGTTETDSLSHKISNESPAGAELIGHVVGDAISFATPSGKTKTYTITKITR